MPTPNNLTHQSYMEYDRRVTAGEQALSTAGYGLYEDDRETAAVDMIANVLTALYGPAGYYMPTEVTTEADVMAEARELVERALRSYMHDNEDYIVEAVA